MVILEHFLEVQCYFGIAMMRIDILKDQLRISRETIDVKVGIVPWFFPILIVFVELILNRD